MLICSVIVYLESVISSCADDDDITDRDMKKL